MSIEIDAKLLYKIMCMLCNSNEELGMTFKYVLDRHIRIISTGRSDTSPISLTPNEMHTLIKYTLKLDKVSHGSTT